MGVRVGMGVGVGMAVMFTRAMLVLMLVRVTVVRTIAEPGFMRVFVLMGVCVFVSLSTEADRGFTRQSASAVFTHYSISIEANSISRPARNSPLAE